jgi:peptidoglycan/LPS O-acetylase OafA/YrhL
MAILLVLLSHARFGTWHLGGGFLGVDIFFVLSGFLITALAVQEWSRYGSFDFLAFYGRRALRLFPALLLMLLLVGTYAVTVGPPSARVAQLKWILAAATYTTNLAIAAQRGGDWPSSLVDHTWSLSVEEQFYLLWPALLVLILLRHRIGPWLATLGLVASIALFAISRAATYTAGNRLAAFVLPDTRLDELLIGCLAALALYWGQFRPGSVTRRWLAVSWPMAALVVIGSIMAFAGQSGDQVDLGALPFKALFDGGATVLCVAVATLVLQVVVQPESALSRALGILPLRWLGQISYGTYIWQAPLFGILDATGHRISGLPSILVALVFGVLSYFLIERRFLRLKTKLSRRSTDNISTQRTEGPTSPRELHKAADLTARPPLTPGPGSGS